MHIAFLIHRYQPYGGLQRDFAQIVQHCLARGHRATLYSMAWQGPPIAGADLRILGRHGLTHPARNRHFVATIQQRLQCEPVDLVVGFNRMQGLDVYFAGDSCFDWKVRHQRGPWYRLWPRTRHYLAAERAVFGPQSATHSLLLTMQQQAQYAACYQTPQQRLHLLPPGATHPFADSRCRAAARAQLRPALQVSDQQTVLLFAASDFATKGLDRALRTLAALPDALLWVAGPGRIPRYQRLAADLGVADRVRFLGARDDMAALMQAADLLLHPARTEAAGLVLVEALCAGLPVITTAVCGHATHIAAAAAGQVLAEPFDQAALTAAVRAGLQLRQRQQWQAAAEAYRAHTPLRGLHQQAADHIETLAATRGLA